MIGYAIGLALAHVGAIIYAAHVLKMPGDYQRSTLLAQLASDVAARVVMQNPTLSGDQLVPLVVNQLATVHGLPTRNGDAIERAAASALLRLGRLPRSQAKAS